MCCWNRDNLVMNTDERLLLVESVSFFSKYANKRLYVTTKEQSIKQTLFGLRRHPLFLLMKKKLLSLTPHHHRNHHHSQENNKYAHLQWRAYRLSGFLLRLSIERRRKKRVFELRTKRLSSPHKMRL